MAANPNIEQIEAVLAAMPMEAGIVVDVLRGLGFNNVRQPPAEVLQGGAPVVAAWAVQQRQQPPLPNLLPRMVRQNQPQPQPQRQNPRQVDIPQRRQNPPQRPQGVEMGDLRYIAVELSNPESLLRLGRDRVNPVYCAVKKIRRSATERAAESPPTPRSPTPYLEKRDVVHPVQVGLGSAQRTAPEAFRGELFGHQRAILSAAMAAEAGQAVPVVVDQGTPTEREAILSVRMGRISSALASGKTVTILALCAGPLPSGTPRVVPLDDSSVADAAGGDAKYSNYSDYIGVCDTSVEDGITKGEGDAGADKVPMSFLVRKKKIPVLATYRNHKSLQISSFRQVGAHALVCAYPDVDGVSFTGGKIRVQSATGSSDPPNAYRRSRPRAGFGGGGMAIRPTDVYPATLIVAAKSVISQWAREAARFVPHLSIRVVEDKRDADAFAAEVEAGVANYSLVLVRAGETSARAAGYPRPDKVMLHELVCRAVGWRHWGRAVFDDFDSAPFLEQAAMPPALFSWYVSATDRAFVNSIPDPTSSKLASAWDWEAQLDAHDDEGDEYGNPTVSPAASWHAAATRIFVRRPFDVAHDLTSMRGAGHIRCDPAYIRACIDLPAIRWRNLRVPLTAAERLVAGDGVLPPEAAELVAAGDPAAAAAAVGIEAESVLELVEGLLGREFERRKTSGRRIAGLTALKTHGAHGVKSGQVGVPTPGAFPGYFRMADIDAVWADRPLPAFGEEGTWTAVEVADVPDYTRETSEAAIAHLAERLEEAMETSEKSVRAIDRMIENFGEGECQVCCDDIELGGTDACDGVDPADVGMFIARCCQAVLCPDCSAARRSARGGREFFKHCPCCNKPTGGAAGFVYIAAVDISDFDGADDIVAAAELEQTAAAEAKQAKAEEEAAAAKEAAAAASEAEKQKEAELADALTVHTAVAEACPNGGPRMAILVELLTGHVWPEAEEPLKLDDAKPPAGLSRGALIEGRAEVGVTPAPADIPTIVFSTSPASAMAIRAGLTAAGVSCAALLGTRASVDAASRAFKRGEVQVLIAPTADACAGLHLPEAGRVVLYHKHHDRGAAVQAVARAQRPGRTCSLEVVNILNERGH